MPRSYWVYIISNRRRTTLYIGVTNDLQRRMNEHRNALVEGFSKKYRLKCLLYCEETDDIWAAIKREKQLKKWKRAWKEELIATENPDWRDLSAQRVE